jgi:hypothetical protein
LSLRRRGLTCGQQQQRSRNRERVFHYRSSDTFPVARLQILSLLAFQMRAPRKDDIATFTMAERR